MNIKKIIFLFFLFRLLNTYSQENNGFEIIKERKVKIRYKTSKNLIILPVILNGVSLNFLLDSGVSESLLFRIDNKDLVLNNSEVVKLGGLGGSEELTAYRTRGNVMQLHKRFLDNNHNILVVLNEDFNISHHLGVVVHGILGTDFFKNHAIYFEFSKNKLTIFPKSYNYEKIIKKMQNSELEIEKNKAYIEIKLENNQQLWDKSKMLIDLGNSDAVWVFDGTLSKFELKSKHFNDFLGRGFNGDVYGERSKLDRLYFGNYQINKPLLALPNKTSINTSKMIQNRVGSLGMEILRRFDVIMDYTKNKFYFVKNRNFKDKFRQNTTGLTIINLGITEQEKNNFNKSLLSMNANEIINNLPDFGLQKKFLIIEVKKESIAEKSGLKSGDVILEINGKNHYDIDMKELNRVLQNPKNGEFHILIKRGKVIMKFDFKNEFEDD